ncbi:hypothetical protein GA707_01580 [Nostocoides sp. F2B08]|nr:hypothetical protein GA707_01580 [Tetrasphaera sp. F2B08]
MSSPAGRVPQSRLTLEYPMSLGVFDTYEEAQKAVDYLSDKQFPVENVLIVGTDLRQLERVTGRLTRSKVAAGGAISGAWLGAFVGLIFALFAQDGFALVRVVLTMAFGALFGLVWALVGYQVTGGNRDFMSISQVVATRYEVLTEHKHVARARELLHEMDPMRAAEEQAARAREAAIRASQAQQTQSPQPPPPAPYPPGQQPPPGQSSTWRSS